MSTTATDPTNFETNGLRGTLKPDIMYYLASPFRTAHAIVAEYANNARDARSPDFDVEVKGNGDVIMIDRGEGMPADRFAAFIGAGDRSKRDEARDNLGNFGFGATAGFGSHRVIEIVETSTAGDPYVHSFRFTAEQAFEASLPGGQPLQSYRRIPKSQARYIKTSGTVIALRERRTDEDRVVITASKLTSNLHRVMPPRMRKSVRINGKSLKVIEPDGKFFDSGDEGVRIPGAGLVQIMFGVSSKTTRPIDYSWGSTGHKWTHGELCSNLPDEFREAMPVEYEMPHVWFEIRHYPWKDKELPSRNGFNLSFFKLESFHAVLRWLRKNILPELRKQLRLFDYESDGEEVAVFTRTMEALHERFGEAGEPGSGLGVDPVSDPTGDSSDAPGAEPGNSPDPSPVDPPEDENPLRVNPTTVTLLVGQIGEFFIEDVDQDATYLVESVEDNGPKIRVGRELKKQLKRRGLESFQIKAGTLYGRDYTLRVTKSLPGKPDTKVRLLVKVLKELKFGISPGGITLEQGETYPRELRIDNAQGLSGFTWEFSGGRVVVSEDGMRATPTAASDADPGKYRVRVVASDGTEAFCRVRIKEPLERKKPTTTRSRNVVIEGVRFRLQKRPLPGNLLTKSFSTSSTIKSYEIMVNLERPVALAARRAGPKAFEAFVLRWTIMEIAKVLTSLELARKETKGMVDDPLLEYQLILERTQLRLLDKALG